MNLGYLLTSFEGRIGRKQYWLGTLALSLVVVAVIGLVIALFDPSGFAGRLVLVGFQLIVLYPACALYIKRFHDRNKPGAFALIGFVPFAVEGALSLAGAAGDPLAPSPLERVLMTLSLAVGIWFFVELGCLKGTPGPNRFGPDPLGRPQRVRGLD
jgi:uncharacterized membrane protein YhaH (DUF805 family)